MSDFKIKGSLVVEGSGLTVAGSQVSTASSTETLTNKTINADNNTISNIANSQIKSGAAIDAAKIADGSVSSAEFQYLGGVTSDIQTQINGKANTSHTHVISDVTGLQDALDDKIETSERGAVNGVATLGADGKLTNSQVPAIAITDTFVVASEVAMLALTVETGDVAVRTDLNKSFILQGTDPTELTDWQELLSPTDQVQSVNGATGTVVLDSDDINEGSSNLYFTNARAKSAAVADAINDGTTDVAPSQNAVFDALANKVAVNAPITGETKTKITYDAKGLVTAGADATTSDIGEGSNLYFTDSRAKTAAVVNSTAGSETDQAPSVSAIKSYITTELAGVPVGSAGDINETSFSMANDQSLSANVTGLAFANATVRSFKALVSVEIEATANRYEVFELIGIQKAGAWDLAQTAAGDNSEVVFTITTGGQIQYVSADVAGFVSGDIKFRATTTSV